MKNSAMSCRKRDPSTRSAIWLNGFDARLNKRERYGTVSQRSNLLPKNSTIRDGASRTSRALRDGGVSTTTRS